MNIKNRVLNEHLLRERDAITVQSSSTYPIQYWFAGELGNKLRLVM